MSSCDCKVVDPVVSPDQPNFPEGLKEIYGGKLPQLIPQSNQALSRQIYKNNN
jgi:hypothetical protein